VLADCPLLVAPLALDCAPWPAVELAPPLADWDVLLVAGDVALLVEGEALPDVLPEVLPEPDDWLVCAPWFIVEDGLVVVAL